MIAMDIEYIAYLRSKILDVLKAAPTNEQKVDGQQKATRVRGGGAGKVSRSAH